MRVWRLALKVTVATTTNTASTDPRMADRTGTALRPTPGSRAKRTPLTADSGIPEEAAYPAMAERWASGSSTRQAASAGGQAVGHEQGGADQDDHQREDTESEHRPVQGHAGRGIDAMDGAEGEERGESHGHAERQHRSDGHRSHHSHESVPDDHRSTAAQRTQDIEVVDTQAEAGDRSSGRQSTARPGRRCLRTPRERWDWASMARSALASMAGTESAVNGPKPLGRTRAI